MSLTVYLSPSESQEWSIMPMHRPLLRKAQMFGLECHSSDLIKFYIFLNNLNF